MLIDEKTIPCIDQVTRIFVVIRVELELDLHDGELRSAEAVLFIPRLALSSIVVISIFCKIYICSKVISVSH